MPSFWFPLMLSMADVWAVWQCPSHTLETEYEDVVHAAEEQGKNGMGHPILPFIPVSSKGKMDKGSNLLLIFRKKVC